MSGAETIIRTLRQDHVQADFRHHTVSLEDAFVHHIGGLSQKNLIKFMSDVSPPYCNVGVREFSPGAYGE